MVRDSLRPPPRTGRVVVRLARAEDDAALARLDRDAWPPGTGFPSLTPSSAPFFDRHRPEAHLVAEQGDRLVGWVRLGAPTPLAENAHVVAVQGLAVDPAARGRGIGSALLEAVVDAARRRGARKVSLRVLSTNPRAQALYARHGFVVEGVLRGEFLVDGDEVDDVLMARPIPAPSGSGSLRGPRGALHHVELWVPDLDRAEASWGWLLRRLGWAEHHRWDAGVSYRLGATCVVLEASPGRSATHHDRLRPGLDHLALQAGTPRDVEDLVAGARGHGWRLLFADRHPYAGGPAHSAAYLEDEQGYEVELVAR